MELLSRRPRAAVVLAAVALSLLLAGAGAAAGSAAGSAKTEHDAEYGVKAAFLFNFTKFVDWPPAAFADARSPFNLCVLGDDPFGPLLDETVANETVGGRPIAVRRGARTADLKGCHLLFVGRSEAGHLRPILRDALHEQSGAVLTVGESEGFLAEGGLVNFFLEANRVRFEVNLAAVERSQLKVSSKLLRVARTTPAAPAGGRP